MSLYHAMFGTEPVAMICLNMLGTTHFQVPRFRDARFMYGDNGTSVEIEILTRTGGGNRETYAAENEALTRLPGYLNDRDVDIDTTYAEWRFAVPEAMREEVESWLATHGTPPSFSEKFAAKIEMLRGASR